MDGPGIKRSALMKIKGLSSHTMVVTFFSTGRRCRGLNAVSPIAKPEGVFLNSLEIDAKALYFGYAVRHFCLSFALGLS